MSRTDKTRPDEVAYNDPYNSRFFVVGNDGTEKWTWKPLTSCKNSKWCCNKNRLDRDKRSKKLQARKELRNLSVEDLYIY